MTTTVSSTETLEYYMNEYKELSPYMRTLVRRVASMELQQQNYQEIGSSDVSCEVYNLRKYLGSYDAVVRYGLELIQNNL